jgi:hypothetical protein
VPKSKPVILINGKSWQTQSAARDHFKDMLARYEDEDIVEDWADHEDLAALIARYDSSIIDGPSKAGSGIEHFLKRRNVGDGYSTPSFWIRRTDGTETDFSYITAIKGEPKSDAQSFHDACREAVAADIAIAKRRYFEQEGDDQGKAPCDESGEAITIDEAHMDHSWPTFSQLVMKFRAERSWTHELPSGVLSEPSDNQTTTTFAEARTADAFRAFHHREATGRVVKKGVNLARGGSQRRPDVKRPIKFQTT